MSYYGYTDPNPSEIELNNREISRKAAEEGIVLLKNENALPLKNKKIALYGIGARFTRNNGLGSGSLESRHDVKIEKGLLDAGYTITTQKWLDDYDNEQKEAYKQFHDMVESKIVGMTNPVDVIGTVRSYVYIYPSGRAITNEDIQASNTDTAIYVLTRQAGEGNDRKLEKGDYYITDIEKENLKIITKSYSNTILIINVGGLIDMSFLDEIPDIKSIIQYTQAGEKGGNALANLLSGKVNFSGKLVDTIPLCYEDIPFGNEYSHLNGQIDNEYYKEGIYVGYRYFDSFRKKVRYPFGFGLSYTKFAIETETVTQNNQTIILIQKVTNTGTFSGKEVVQVYVSIPGQNKEYQRLVGFEKTAEIDPNCSQKVQITFNLLEDCTSYSEDEACWKLEKGLYIIRVGNSSRDTKIAAKLNLKESFVSYQCKNCCKCVDKFEELVSSANEFTETDSNTTTIDTSTFVTHKHEYKQPKNDETDEEKKILDSIPVESQMEFLVGANLTQQSPAGCLEIITAAGKTTTNLISYGIRNVIFADGPAGLSILSEVCYKKDGTNACVPVNVPDSYNWGLFGEFMRKNICSSNGQIIYRYTTCWPCAVLLAQTWNPKNVEEVGTGISNEMEKYGISVILGPALNIHRNPLCGRTFEYFSEDPFITGIIAASYVNGVQNGKKSAACLKHFCCNNCEEDRFRSSSNISERALREIYLKGFQIAVKKSKPKTIMSSYNLLNHVYTANRKDLINDILRCEWGFKGVVMTDWDSCNENRGTPYLATLAGNDLIMPGQDWCREQIKKAIENGKLTKDDVRICAGRVLHLILNAVTEARIEKH